MEHVVYRLRVSDRAIEDYLLSLHARAEDDRALLQFLGKPETLQLIDLKYALRLCTKYGKTRACVLIYSALSLFEEAVELALAVDIELAKGVIFFFTTTNFSYVLFFFFHCNLEHADKPEDDDELRKKLWLRIARHVVQEKRDIKQAMSFLQQVSFLFFSMFAAPLISNISLTFSIF